jgi:hypothetical protein
MLVMKMQKQMEAEDARSGHRPLRLAPFETVRIGKGPEDFEAAGPGCAVT